MHPGLTTDRSPRVRVACAPSRFARLRSNHGTRASARCAAAGRGFTLVELLTVLVIVAILSAVVVPATSQIRTTRERMAANVVLRDFSWVRQRAIASGIRTWLVVDEANDSYAGLVEDAANPGLGNALSLTDPATGRDFQRTFDAADFVGVQILSVNFDSADSIGFDWLGRPLNETENDLAARGSLTLTGGASITVEVETGHVSLSIP